MASTQRSFLGIIYYVEEESTQVVEKVTDRQLDGRVPCLPPSIGTRNSFMRFLLVIGWLGLGSGLTIGGMAAYYFYKCFVSMAGGPCSGIPLIGAVLYAGPALLIGTGLVGIASLPEKLSRVPNPEDDDGGKAS